MEEMQVVALHIMTKCVGEHGPQGDLSFTTEDPDITEAQKAAINCKESTASHREFTEKLVTSLCKLLKSHHKLWR